MRCAQILQITPLLARLNRYTRQSPIFRGAKNLSYCSSFAPPYAPQQHPPTLRHGASLTPLLGTSQFASLASLAFSRQTPRLRAFGLSPLAWLICGLVSNRSGLEAFCCFARSAFGLVLLICSLRPSASAHHLGLRPRPTPLKRREAPGGAGHSSPTYRQRHVVSSLLDGRPDQRAGALPSSKWRCLVAGALLSSHPLQSRGGSTGLTRRVQWPL